MGWWESADGRGLIGDRPADAFDAVLEHSFGAHVDTELFGGLLHAFGGALLRNPAELVADPPPPGTAMIAELAGRVPLAVPIEPGPDPTSFDDAVFDALETAVFYYRETGPARFPTLGELLETLAFAARGRLVDADTGERVELERIRAHRPDRVGDDLRDPNWQVRMLAVAAAGRHGGHDLVQRLRAVELPPASVALRDEDRRALLALRDLAAERAAGAAVERPVHSDAVVAARRAALLADVGAMLDGTGLPGPDSPAYVLRALVDPASVLEAGDAPPEWAQWLSGG
jgi:hypothetical protein